MPLVHGNPNQYLPIISAIITPAILILATGSLVSSTLVRIGRVVDRARALMDAINAAHLSHVPVDVENNARFLQQYMRRSALAERALRSYYIAIGLFVGSCLAIALDELTRGLVPWLALILTVIGACFLFAGTASLVVETQIATGQLRDEIEASGAANPQARVLRAKREG